MPGVVEREAVLLDRPAPAADAVVLATGAFNRARIPPVADDLPPGIAQITPLEYRRPDDLGSGRVLVVGASATGVQIADELLRSGREVTYRIRCPSGETQTPRTTTATSGAASARTSWPSAVATQSPWPTTR